MRKVKKVAVNPNRGRKRKPGSATAAVRERSTSLPAQSESFATDRSHTKTIAFDVGRDYLAKPVPKFQIGQVVTVPIAVAESGKARIVGIEWGPQYARGKADCSGWLYWCVEMVLPEASQVVADIAKGIPPARITSLEPVKGSLLCIAKLNDSAYVPRGGSPWATGEAELVKWAKG